MNPIRRGLAALIAGVLSSAGLVVVGAATSPAEAAWAVPQFVRSVSGNGRPGVFPWGVQYNPVSNEVVVADYLNNQIRRYSTDGRILGSFYRADNKGQPYSLAIDPANGDIYFSEIADGQTRTLVQYSKTGTLIRTKVISGLDYQAWIAIDNAGYLYIADSHYSNNSSSNPPLVRKYRLSDLGQVSSFTILPPGTTSSTVPRLYGIDIDASGNIWLADTFNNKLLKYTSGGSFAGSFGGTGVLHGDARGVAVDDAHNRIYVSDPTVGQVQVFNTAGNFVESLGGGTGVGALNLGAARQPAVGPGGVLYVAEYGNARIHRFTVDGDDASYWPKPAQPAVAGQLGQPRDVDVDDVTGDIWVADSWNQRFQRFGKDGSFIGTWGTRGASLEYGMNYPRGIAIDPTSRRVWVVNQRGHHIKRYEYDASFVDQLGDAEVDSESAGFFRWPLDVEFYPPTNTAMVTDRNSSKVKILDATSGAEIRSFTRNGNHGGAIDPATGNLIVADGTKVYVYNPTGSSLITSFGSSGTGNGQFKHIWDMVVVNGVLYVTDDVASRIQAFSLTGTFLGKWGGFGQGAYQFKNPSGIAADADGKLYVADAGNDRIMVFDTNLAKGGTAWPPPSLTLAYPGSGATVPGRPVRFSGSVTDETAVAGVQISVQDTSTGLWFDAASSTWSSTQTWANSPLVGETSKNMTFAWSFIGVEYSGSYSASIRAIDPAGNLSPVVTRGFGVVADGVADVDPPAGQLTSPAPGSRTPGDPPLVISGEAGDDTGVEAVDVRVRIVGTGQFLQPGGGFSTTAAWMPATLSEPSTTNTAWSWSWADPVLGSYEVAVRPRDVIGNTSVQVVGTFEVAPPLGPDTTPLVLSQLLPAANATVPVAGADISGSATDDRAVASVDVAIKDKATNLWLRADGSWGSFTWLPSTLGQPGAATTSFTRSWAAVPGSFGFQLRAFDGAGNQTTMAFRSFTVE